MRNLILLAFFGIAAYSAPRPIAVPQMNVPMFFEPNAGQTDASVKYLARSQGATLWLTEDGAVLGIAKKSGTAYLRVRFVGGKRAPAIAAEQPSGGISNYFVGKDPAKWRTNVPHFGKVRYREVYPGIDVVFYGNPDQLEYDFVLHPGADPSRIRLAFDGARSLRRNASGDLMIRLATGDVVAHAPVLRQGTTLVGGRYVIRGRHAGFAIDSYDHSAELVIDPILTYATLLGGSVGDQAYATAIDKQGNIFVTGETGSPDFPLKNALFSSIAGQFNQSWHVFLAKINPSASGGASLIFSTLYGSDGADDGLGLALDSNGNPVVVGSTNSSTFDLPQVSAFASPPASKATDCGTAQNSGQCGSAFAVKFNSTGSAMIYSSYLTGSDNDSAQTVTVDSSGNAWLAGNTSSLDFPMQGASFQRTLRGQQGGFVSEISSSGKLVYSTYFNGSSSTELGAIVDGVPAATKPRIGL